MVEGGSFPRSRVMNQMLIDEYLMRQHINLVQHQAGEHLLGQAQRAGIWATGVNLSGTRVTGSRNDFIPFGAFPYGRTIEAIKKKYGWFHQYLVQQVVCFGWDISKDEFRLNCLHEGLDCIAERQLGGGRDPLRALRRAAEG